MIFSVGGGPGGRGGSTFSGGGGPGGGAGIFAGDPGFVGEVGADMVSACNECLLFGGAAMASRPLLLYMLHDSALARLLAPALDVYKAVQGQSQKLHLAAVRH